LENEIFYKPEGQRCPVFKCSPNNKDFENSVFCQRNSIKNPFEVILKNCATFEKISDSDFWGNPKIPLHLREK
jgi:hypothetical protein